MFVRQAAIAIIAVLGVCFLGFAASAALAAQGGTASYSHSLSGSGGTVAQAQYQRRGDARRYARYRRGWRGRRGVYSRGFMNCINSGHPADFCRDVGSDFSGSR
jgi:hypothetical protein